MRNRTSNTLYATQVFERAQCIINDVARRGDNAIIHYTKKLDGVQLKTLRVTDGEIEDAYTNVSRQQIRSIKLIRERLRKSETIMLEHSFKKIKTSSYGITTDRLVQPIRSVG